MKNLSTRRHRGPTPAGLFAQPPTTWDTFAQRQPIAAGWIAANAESSDFAASLRASVLRYGSLSERQLAAVLRNAAPRAASVVVDVAKIVTALQTARDRGLKSPCLRLGDFRFSLAAPTSINAGAVYVKTNKPAAENAYLGKVVDGRFAPSRDCTPEHSAEIARLAADPASSAKVHGHMTGRCACCGLPLTTKASVARGIGPICAEKFGF